MIIRLIIAGGRDFNDYELLKLSADKMLEYETDSQVIVISGKARGADSLGEQYARDNGLDCWQFAPDWVKFGKRAGLLRNKEMAAHATHLLAFWDGKSKGTKHMIEYARSINLKVIVVHYQTMQYDTSTYS